MYTYAACAIRTLDKGEAYSKDTNTLPSEKKLHNDYHRKGSVTKKKKSLVVSLKGPGAKKN
jgi:hypothetical protein